jgi:hypothetical protein
VKRSGIVFATLLLVLFIVGGVSFGQAGGLAVTTSASVVDGVVKAGEYSFSQDFGQMAVYANRTAGALYVAVVGKTTGWVGLGLGSMRMDGSTIFMGFVGTDGKPQFKVQTGAGHQHKDAASAVAESVVAWSIKEADGKTTLEVQLKPDAYIKAGDASLSVIYAQAGEKSFQPRHMFRGSVGINLLK